MIEEDSSEHDAVVNQRAVVRLRPAYDDRTPSVEDYQQSTPLDSMSQSSIPTDMAITVPKCKPYFIYVFLAKYLFYRCSLTIAYWLHEC